MPEISLTPPPDPRKIQSIANVGVLNGPYIIGEGFRIQDNIDVIYFSRGQEGSKFYVCAPGLQVRDLIPNVPQVQSNPRLVTEKAHVLMIRPRTGAEIPGFSIGENIKVQVSSMPDGRVSLKVSAPSGIQTARPKKIPGFFIGQLQKFPVGNHAALLQEVCGYLGCFQLSVSGSGTHEETKTMFEGERVLFNVGESGVTFHPFVKRGVNQEITLEIAQIHESWVRAAIGAPGDVPVWRESNYYVGKEPKEGVKQDQGGLLALRLGAENRDRYLMIGDKIKISRLEPVRHSVAGRSTPFPSVAINLKTTPDIDFKFLQ